MTTGTHSRSLPPAASPVCGIYCRRNWRNRGKPSLRRTLHNKKNHHHPQAKQQAQPCPPPVAAHQFCARQPFSLRVVESMRPRLFWRTITFERPLATAAAAATSRPRQTTTPPHPHLPPPPLPRRRPAAVHRRVRG